MSCESGTTTQSTSCGRFIVHVPSLRRVLPLLVSNVEWSLRIAVFSLSLLLG